ncbi:MAG: right-handed parallel beta-helix repeat-containing protein [Deinococcales bacterium]|nr:right-handed parallel beta-helix repeat-containing protein [Chitinophagaceae bacterium]
MPKNRIAHLPFSTKPNFFKLSFLSAFIPVLFSIQLSAQVWHVAGNGDDANDGKTTKTAFKTLQKAANLVQPGDVVLIGDGVYTDTGKSDGSAVVNIFKSGKPNAWITFKAEIGAKPVVHPYGWCGIQIKGSYIIIDGLTVIGNNDSTVLLHAQEDAKKKQPNPYFNSNGIVVEGRKNKPEEKPHHTIIRNCEVGKCAGGGIVGLEMDYLTVEDCKVYENAWFMRYGGSGISLLNNWAFDDAPGYHIIIQRNYVWNNKTLVNWETIGKLSDGNGIILDVTDQARSGATNPNADAVVKKDTTAVNAPQINPKPKRPEWKGRALIANNLSAYNGGSGIHVFRTKYVDIINNTTYHNGGIVGYQELFPNNSEDVVILNNIIVPRPGGKVTSNNKNTNIKWDFNLYPIDQNVFKGANDIVADPKFLDIQLDITKGNFRLAKTSLGINSGSKDVPQVKDITGKLRPIGGGTDRGAFEQ